MHYLLLTTIAIFLWGSFAVLVDKLAHFPPFLLLALSLLIGGSLSIVRWRQWQLQPMLIFVGVVGIFGYHFLLFMALRMTEPVAANLLNYLWPLLILLFTPIFFPDFNLLKRHIVGILISFIGAALIIIDSSMTPSIESLLGGGLAVLSAFIWAIYTLISKKMARYSSATVGLFCLISGALALIVHVFIEVTPLFSSTDIGLIFILGKGPMGISFYCWDKAIKEGDPRIIATLSYFTPLLSTALLVFVNDLSLTSTLIYAMLLIVSGALIANISLKNKRKIMSMS